MADIPTKGASTPLDETPIALRPETYARHDAAARYVESMNRTPTPQRSTSRGPWVMPCQIAKATSSITARSSATYGSGSAKLQSDSGTALVDDGDTITVKNMTDKTIASGAYVLVVWALGKWWVAAVGSCGNLS
jgi:hypothetical protein